MKHVPQRANDIQYSIPTRHRTDTLARTPHLRAALPALIEALPERKVPGHLQETLPPYLDDRVFNIIQLIYQAKPMEQQFKDYAFGRIAMRRHWDAGLQDMVDTLTRPAFFALPDLKRGVATHDVHRIFARDAARAERACRRTPRSKRPAHPQVHHPPHPHPP